MAKVIKCPNCGDNVELPPQIAGQLIKCNACGTSIRLVAKKPGQLGAKAGASQVSSPGSSMSGTLVDAGPDPDAPPSLGSECSVCGRTFEPSELTEDRGRLVCYICGNQPLRSSGGPVLRTQADETHIRHGPLVTVNAAFIGAIVAALIWLMCQAYLTFYPRPQGTRVAVASVPAAQPAPPAAVITAEQKLLQDFQIKFNEADALKRGNQLQQSAEKLREALALFHNLTLTPQQVAMRDRAQTELDILENLIAAKASPPVPPENIASVSPKETPKIRPAVPPPGEIAIRPGSIFVEAEEVEKLADGLAALEQKHWDEAIRIFNSFSIPRDLIQASEDQLLALEGLGAANLAAGNLNAAEGTLERLYNANRRTPSFLLNRAVVQLALNRNAVKILRELAPLLEKPGKPDEMVQAVFGTALNRLPPLRTPQDERLKLTNLLSAYTQRLDATKADRRRWGAQWLPTREVERNQRLAELESQNLKRLEEEADRLMDRLQAAQRARTNAAGGRPNEIAAAQDQERRAQEDYDAKVREIDQLKKGMEQPQWLETFSPIVPQRSAARASP